MHRDKYTHTYICVCLYVCAYVYIFLYISFGSAVPLECPDSYTIKGERMDGRIKNEEEETLKLSDV